MKIIITADIHNGIQGKLKDTAWSMSIIRQYASKYSIEHVLILGDLFHDRVNLNIEVLNTTYDELKKCNDSGQTWYCFPGNHDMFLKNSWEVTSLHVLKDVLKVIQNESKLKIGEQIFWVLPFIHFESKYMEELEALNKSADSDDILLTHIGVNSATLNVCFLLQNWNIVDLSKTIFKRIYTGHFHCHQQVGTKIWYPGSPIPFRFDEGVVDHGFFVYDTEKNEHEFIKIFDICSEFSGYRPPDYITIVDQDLTESIGLVTNNKVRILLSKDYTSNELETIRMVLKKKGAVYVDWTEAPKKVIAEEINSSILESGSTDDIFKAWVEHDKPDLDIDLLMAVYKQVKQDAEERYVVEEIDE